MKDEHTSKNQSYRAKKSGRPNKSETAPSAVGIEPRFPPFNKLVKRLLALSSRFLFVLGSPTSVDWHLHKHFTQLSHKQQVQQHNHTLPLHPTPPNKTTKTQPISMNQASFQSPCVNKKPESKSKVQDSYFLQLHSLTTLN